MRIPKEINIAELIKKDSERFNHIYAGVLERIKKTKGVERFLLSWALIEQITLPSLIRTIFHKLSLKNLPELERLATSQLINYYFLLSHDASLYRDLVKGNNLRNNIVHQILEGADSTNSGNNLAKECNFVLGELLVPILERLTGKFPIPVLTLYARGWNDFRGEMLKILENMKEELNNG